MKQSNAISTATQAMEAASQALKPAIVDLLSADMDYDAATVMKAWLSMRSHAEKLMRRVHNTIPAEY